MSLQDKKEMQRKRCLSRRSWKQHDSRMAAITSSLLNQGDQIKLNEETNIFKNKAFPFNERRNWTMKTTFTDRTYFFWCSSQANSALVFSFKAFSRRRRREDWWAALISSSFIYCRTISIVNLEKLSCPPENGMLRS